MTKFLVTVFEHAFDKQFSFEGANAHQFTLEADVPAESLKLHEAKARVQAVYALRREVAELFNVPDSVGLFVREIR